MNLYEVRFQYRDSYGSHRGGGLFVEANTEEQAIDKSITNMHAVDLTYQIRWKATLVQKGKRKLP